MKRSTRSLAWVGTSTIVTSLTDLVTFAISSTSALPALASINIFFLSSALVAALSACGRTYRAVGARERERERDTVLM